METQYGLYIKPVFDYILRQEKYIASFKPKYKVRRLQLNMGSSSVGIERMTTNQKVGSSSLSTDAIKNNLKFL